MNYPFWITTGLLVLGLYTMIAHRNLMKKLVGMTIFQTAIILFFLLLSVKRGAGPPIVETGLPPEAFMNPAPPCSDAHRHRRHGGDLGRGPRDSHPTLCHLWVT